MGIRVRGVRCVTAIQLAASDSILWAGHAMVQRHPTHDAQVISSTKSACKMLLYHLMASAIASNAN